MTAQASDSLLFNGKQFSLYLDPLESFFSQNPPRPSFVAESTANWRGYIAGWEIADDRFNLVGLSGRICIRDPEAGGEQSSWCPVGHSGECEVKDFGISDLFNAPSEGVFAEWFTGEIPVPSGEMVEYVHAGYGSKYERYMMVNIERGVVSSTRVIGPETYEKERAANWAKRKKQKKRWWQIWK